MVFGSKPQQVSLDSPALFKTKELCCNINKIFFNVNEQVKVKPNKHIKEFNESPKYEKVCSPVYVNCTDDDSPDVIREETEQHVDNSHYTWCHYGLCRLEAQEKLLSRKQEGMYLVRKSSQADIPHVLSVYHQDKVYHMKIRQEDDTFMIGDARSIEPVFPSLPALIAHFHRFPIILKHDKSITALLRLPLPH